MSPRHPEEAADHRHRPTHPSISNSIVKQRCYFPAIKSQPLAAASVTLFLFAAFQAAVLQLTRPFSESQPRFPSPCRATCVRRLRQNSRSDHQRVNNQPCTLILRGRKYRHLSSIPQAPNFTRFAASATAHQTTRGRHNKKAAAVSGPPQFGTFRYQGGPGRYPGSIQ